MTRMIQCIHLKKEAEGLAFAPYPGELGTRIYNQVSKEAFEIWKRHQTMLVNENRLNLADAKARQYLARQMEQFFFGGGADQPTGYVPPSDETKT
jgi:Fe-S cluster biosynthesis and repair protein YggX